MAQNSGRRLWLGEVFPQRCWTIQYHKISVPESLLTGIQDTCSLRHYACRCCPVWLFVDDGDSNRDRFGQTEGGLQGKRSSAEAGAPRVTLAWLASARRGTGPSVLPRRGHSSPAGGQPVDNCGSIRVGLSVAYLPSPVYSYTLPTEGWPCGSWQPPCRRKQPMCPFEGAIARRAPVASNTNARHPDLSRSGGRP